jgi:hypothetical protein
MSIESALKDVAAALEIPDYTALAKLINFESNFDPKARNPYTGAGGLIQFMPDTARSLGFKSVDDLLAQYPDVESQLRNPVLKYLSQFKPFRAPFPQSLYLAVFYPSYRYSPPDTAFSDTVRKVNPGINVVGDYVSWVEKKTSKIVFLKKYAPAAFLVPVLIAAAVILYRQYRPKQYLITQ